MKSVIISIALLLAASFSNGQTTATNWTATDCNGVSHTLFSELDSNKIIIFVWVMPCNSCINPSKTAYKVAQNFAVSHPGKVRYYLADDLGDAGCPTLNTWVTTNIGTTSGVTIFSNSGNVIDEANFGGSGMPHVVVMSGTGHQIYFNKKNGAADDSTGISNAVFAAMGTTGVATVNRAPLTLSPNPVTGNFAITYEQAITSVRITSVSGQLINELSYPGGKMNPVVDLSKYAEGMYMVQVVDVDGKTVMQKVVKQ